MVCILLQNTPSVICHCLGPTGTPLLVVHILVQHTPSVNRRSLEFIDPLHRVVHVFLENTASVIWHCSVFTAVSSTPRVVYALKQDIPSVNIQYFYGKFYGAHHPFVSHKELDTYTRTRDEIIRGSVNSQTKSEFKGRLVRHGFNFPGTRLLRKLNTVYTNENVSAFKRTRGSLRV